MRKRSSPVRQLNLFHPPRITPSWTDLPLQVREEIVQLLTMILQEHALREQLDRKKGESANE